MTRPAASSGSRPPARRRWWGRILPISQPIAEALARRRARRSPDSPLVFHRDGIPIRRWRTAWRTACQAAGVPTRFLHDCRRTAARNLIRASVPERVAMLLTGHKTRAIFDRLQHHQRAGTARGRRPAGRLSGAARTGDTAWRAAEPLGKLQILAILAGLPATDRQLGVARPNARETFSHTFRGQVASRCRRRAFRPLHLAGSIPPEKGPDLR